MITCLICVCGNRESRCPTAAENSPAEVIKTTAKQTRSSAEPQKVGLDFTQGGMSVGVCVCILIC